MKKPLKLIVASLVSSALMPAIIIASAYYKSDVSLGLLPLAALAGLTALTLLLWFALYLIFRSPASAFLGCLLLTAANYTASTASESLALLTGRSTGFCGMVYLGAGFAFSIIVTLIFRKCPQKLESVMLFFATVMISILFVYNSGIAATKLYAVYSNGDSLSSPPKADYFVDSATQTPDIYWIHTDGMIGFDAFEQLYKDPQAEFTAELTERGFDLDKTARLYSGHCTMIALTMLMNPDFYDSSLADKDFEMLDGYQRTVAFDRIYVHASEQLKYNELLCAMTKRGYTTSIIGVKNHPYYYPACNRYYYTDGIDTFLVENDKVDYDAAVKTADYFQLKHFVNVVVIAYSAVMDLVMGNDYTVEGRAVVQSDLPKDKVNEILLTDGVTQNHGYIIESLNDSFKAASPSFTVIHSMISHYPFYMDENGNSTGYSSTNPDDYADQHRASAKILINMIDMILEHNPDAVIVIQSDHGLHGTAQSMTACGYGDELSVLWNSTISAIRVPDKYKTGQERFANENPLNLSRYLVNSFVGKNYEYVTP